MVDLELELPDDKIGWLGLVEESIHDSETFRVHISGIQGEDEMLNLISIELPKGIKLKGGSQILRREYENRRFIGTISELPFWKDIHEGEDFIEVDFEAEIVETTRNSITIRLPDSYKKSDHVKKPKRTSKSSTFTFKTEHTYLVDIISRIINDNPIVELRGPLSDLNPRDNKVEIVWPVSIEAQTLGGGCVRISPQEITLATVNDLPGWRKQTEEGFIYVMCEAVILKAEKDEITISLPKHYR